MRSKTRQIRGSLVSNAGSLADASRAGCAPGGIRLFTLRCRGYSLASVAAGGRRRSHCQGFTKDFADDFPSYVYCRRSRGYRRTRCGALAATSALSRNGSGTTRTRRRRRSDHDGDRAGPPRRRAADSGRRAHCGHRRNVDAHRRSDRRFAASGASGARPTVRAAGVALHASRSPESRRRGRKRTPTTYARFSTSFARVPGRSSAMASRTSPLPTSPTR